MKISNEKTLINFANSKHVDKEGYLLKRGEGDYNNLKISKDSLKNSCESNPTHSIEISLIKISFYF